MAELWLIRSQPIHLASSSKLFFVLLYKLLFLLLILKIISDFTDTKLSIHVYRYTLEAIYPFKCCEQQWFEVNCKYWNGNILFNQKESRYITYHVSFTYATHLMVTKNMSIAAGVVLKLVPFQFLSRYIHCLSRK